MARRLLYTAALESESLQAARTLISDLGMQTALEIVAAFPKARNNRDITAIFHSAVRLHVERIAAGDR